MTDTADLIGLAAGIGQRQSTFLFDLLDQGNSVLGRLTVDASAAPEITNNINRTVKRTMSGLVLPPDVAADVDPLRMRVRPSMVLQNGERLPLGVFLFSEASYPEALYGSAQFVTPPGPARQLRGTMTDQLAMLDQGSRGINFYRAGASVYDAIVQQLEAGGVIDYVVDPTDATFASHVVWKPNEKRLTVINDLLRMVGYYSLYFDNSGVARARTVPTLDAADIDHAYTYGTVTAGSVVATDDTLSAPNTYVVVNSSFTDAPVWGEWQVPSAAPNSYANRGFWVVQEHDIQAVESNTAAGRSAKAIGQADFATYKWLRFTSPLNPLHDTFGITSWPGGERYREQQWGFRLLEGEEMSHVWRRIYAEDVADLVTEEA